MDLGPEDVLSYTDSGSDTAVEETVSKLQRALRFISNWYQAVDETENRKIWYTRIDAARKKVEAALTEWNKAGLLFPGNKAKSAYTAAQNSYFEVWSQLQNSADLLPESSVLDDIVGAAENAPGAVADSITKAIAKSLNEIFGNLWPWFLVAAILAGLYFAAKAGLLNKLSRIFR